MGNHIKNVSANGLAKRYIIVGVLAITIITAAIIGFFNFGHGLPSVSANTIFSETVVQGISEPATVTDEQNNIEVYKALSPGVVLISTNNSRNDFYGNEDDERGGTGSGSVIDKNGHILTNEHVVRNAQRLTVNLGGDKVYNARIVGTDPDTDLAVIKIDAPADVLTVMPVGDSENLKIGQKVLAIGNPFGLDRTLTTGVISGLQRPIRSRNGRQIEGAIQTDASINPGNSGGPLLDSRGRMIGVNSQILSPSGASNGIGFAIPASIVKRVVPQLIQSGRVSRPRLGVGVRSVSELTQQGIRLPLENGLLVITVAQGSAAEKAGLRETTQGYDGRINMGDIITSVDGQEIKSIDELYKVIDKRQIGDTIQLEILRDGQKKTLSVKLEAQSNTDNESEQRQQQMPRKTQRFNE